MKVKVLIWALIASMTMTLVIVIGGLIDLWDPEGVNQSIALSISFLMSLTMFTYLAILRRNK